MTETRKKVTDAADNGADNKDDSARTKLSAEAHEKKPEAKPEPTKIIDVSDKAKEALTTKSQEVIGHVSNAQVASREIAQYVSAKKPLDEKVQVTDADGKVRETTVGERIKELKRTVDKEANAAVFESGKIDQPTVSAMLNNSLLERNTLAKELGLNSSKLSMDSIDKAIQQTGDATRLGKLQELLVKQTSVEQLKTMENSPAYSRMIYAQLKGGGYTNENTPVEILPNGKLKTSQADLLDAMTLLTEAGGNNKELRNHRLYLDAVNEVFPRLENGSVKVQALNKSMQEAIDAGAKGDKVAQEKALKEAVEQADKINVPVIAQLIKDPGFAGRQNQEVLGEMANTVVMASTARLQYAQFLAEQGRYGEAQVQTLRVKTECPEVMYNVGPDGKINYNDNRFVNLAKLDEQMKASSTFDPNKLNSDIKSFRDNLVALQGGATNAGDETDKSAGDKAANNGKIKENLAALNDSMNGQLATQKTQLTDSKTALDAQKVKLEAELKALGSKTALTEDAGKIEELRINRELQMIKLQSENIDGQLQANAQNTQLVRLLQANYDLAREDRSAARAKLDEIANLESVAKGEPPFAEKNKEAFEQMREASEEPGWFDKWGKKLFVGLAVVAGVAAGIWLGPGAIATGMAAGTAAATALGVGAVGTAVLTTAGAVTAVGVVTGVGALSGGAVMATGHGLGEVTGGRVTSKETLWEDVALGMNVGGKAAFWTAAPGAIFKAPGVVAGATEGTVATATNVSMLGRAVNGLKTTAVEGGKSMLTPTPYVFGLGAATINTGLDKATYTGPKLNTTMGEEFTNFGKSALSYSLLAGFGGPLTTGGPFSGLATKMVGAERAPMLAGYMTYEAISQPIQTYSDYQNVKNYGAAWDGYKSSTAVFGPWGPSPYNEANSLMQATVVRDNFRAMDMGQRFYSEGINKAPKPYWVGSSNVWSSFNDASAVANQRIQGDNP